MWEIFTLSLGFSRFIFEESFVATFFFFLGVFSIIFWIFLYYMAPSFIAYCRMYKNFKVILLLNLFSIFLLPFFFGGLTFLAWFLCFVFAWIDNVDEKRIEKMNVRMEEKGDLGFGFLPAVWAYGRVGLFKVLIFMIFIIPPFVLLTVIIVGIGIPLLIIFLNHFSWPEIGHPWYIGIPLTGEPIGDYLAYLVLIFSFFVDTFEKTAEKIGIVLKKTFWKIIKWGLMLFLLFLLYTWAETSGVINCNLTGKGSLDLDYKQFKKALIECANRHL